MAEPADALKQKVDSLKAPLGGHTLFLMIIIALGAFAAYLFIIKPRQSGAPATGTTTGSNPPVGTFISEPIQIVNNPPAQSIGVTVTPTPAPGPPVIGRPIHSTWYRGIVGDTAGPAGVRVARNPGETGQQAAALLGIPFQTFQDIPGEYSAFVRQDQPALTVPYSFLNLGSA